MAFDISMDNKTICKEIVKRPGLYVGTARLDYVQHFMGGLKSNKFLNEPKVHDKWNLNYELQYWLMAKQSVCIRHAATLNGWSLFYRCFGSGASALMYFAEYLRDVIPEPDAAENYRLHEICAAYDVYNDLRKIHDDEKTIYKYASI